MKVALVHDWLTGMRGGEKVLEVLCEIFPDADILTLLHIPGSVSKTIESHPIRTSPLHKFPWAETRYRHYLPLMPWAIERLNFSGYSLIVSSSHCVAKAAKSPKGGLHVCYCHTPMRYIWDQYEMYFSAERASWLVRTAMAMLRRPLQRWDVAVSDRVHIFVTNSYNVASRIQRHYGREATVIYPPVEVERFRVGEGQGGYYLVVSALAPYKRIDLAIDACTQLGRSLKIVGTGPEESRLRARAGSRVEFLGWKTDPEVARLYTDAAAVLFPGEEDFGIVPLEAQACGRPVIAFGRGGARETVIPLNEAPSGEPADPSGSSPGPTGVFFQEQTADALTEAILTYERHRQEFDPTRLRRHAAAFDRAIFKEKIAAFIQQTYAACRAGA